MLPNLNEFGPVDNEELNELFPRSSYDLSLSPGLSTVHNFATVIAP
jgi:hypothetical protein